MADPKTLERKSKMTQSTERHPADQEPDCTCTQVDVDLFDPRSCEFHNPRSSWNQEQRAEARILADFLSAEARVREAFTSYVRAAQECMEARERVEGRLHG